MRIWTLHPKHLDPQGLVALWREGLLARAVLLGRTKGYRHHPQLERFQDQAEPVAAIDAYLWAVHAEATARGYAFDRTKLGQPGIVDPIAATEGQLAYEWAHLLAKLQVRSPELHRRWAVATTPDLHPSFTLVSGGVASWERP